VLFLVAIAIVVISGVTHADNGNNSQSGRLITIYDRGIEKVILSEATTIGDALKEAGIAIDDKDAVEPAVTEKLVASDYQVNIYRARPVVIVDGNTRTKTVTPYQTALQISQSAGIKLYDEDTTNLERTDDIIAEGAGLKLTINRATPFSFTLYGKTTTVRTQGATVGEMLSEKGIILGKDDRLSLNPDTKITEMLAVRVWREGKQTITVDEPVDFDVEKIEDADREVSYLEIKAPGEKGSRNVTYEVTIQDGIEVSRIEIASITTKQPIKQVELVGIKGKYTTPSENETITWDFLTANGFSRQQTAGIMGNLMQEHKFNTSDSSGGYGIAQWTDGRKYALMLRPNSDNIYVQLNYLMDELNTGYVGVRDEIKSSDSMEDTVIIFQNKFERCNPYYCMQDQRIQYARNILASH
jgi:uncharacterized protein YabE (DUF348 family)